MSIDDDEENEPLAKRMCRLFNQGVDQQKPSTEPTDGNLNQDNALHETPISRVPDARTLSVALMQHQEWDNPNFLSMRDPKSERMWQYFEQLQNTKPLQTVMPTTQSCMTPSPPSQKISLGMTQMEKKSTQCTSIKVHPLLKGRKLDKDDEERLRRWATNGSLEKRQVVASYEGKQHLVLVREDICTLLPQRWVNSNWMCSTFNDSESLRNLDSFREVPTVSYVGLGPHFGDDSRYFDKIAASMQKWWFVLVCIDRHWWLFAFEIAQKRLWVLDSMYSGEYNDDRSNMHAYVGRIIEDIAKVLMSAYEPTENGLPRFYPSVPKQHNGCDCGVFGDVLQEFRKKIILDIVIGPHNSQIGKALRALDSDPVHRNQPRKKTKAVRSPFTAPSMKSMLQRAGLPTRKPSKRGRQGRRQMPRCVSCEPDKPCFTAVVRYFTTHKLTSKCTGSYQVIPQVKTAQKSPPAYFCTWRMSRVRVSHAYASMVFFASDADASVTHTRRCANLQITRTHQSRVRVAMESSKSCVRVSYTHASLFAAISFDSCAAETPSNPAECYLK
ncbi:uncharacterized protein DS421_6g183370 [Arachis hypogaea]|nr:uncharacterized protein DS421_6g183370 [Arachis hypogaea]